MEKRSYLFGRDHSIDPRNRPQPSIVPTARTNLYTLYDDSEGSMESLASTSNDTASVYLRVRPTMYDSHYLVENNVFKILNHNRSVEKQFQFSAVFEDVVMQREVYSSSVESSVDNEENLTLLMYGTSGSGKTYTLMGDADQPGIIPRAIEHIFTRHGRSISTVPKFKPVGGNYKILSDDEIDTELLRRQLYFKQNNGSIFSGDTEKIQSEHNFIELKPCKASVDIWISFFEIYNESINDLLDVSSTNSAKKREGLKVISNSGNTFVKDLTTVFTHSSAEAMQLLTAGLNYRLNASTCINTNSSRSHCLFLIDVIKHEKKTVFHNHYRFCDLAGSERVKKSETTGSRLKEAQNINTSLLVLGRCLDIALANQGKKKGDLVPFRESKLTTFLQSALKGFEKLTMIVNIWPITEFYEENLHVLNYASIAQKIIYKTCAPVRRTSVSRRYSLFLGMEPNAQLEGESNLSIILDENFRLQEVVDQLTDENDHLLAVIDQLEEQKAEVVKLNESIERGIRQEMTDYLMTELRRKEQSVEARLQVKIDFLTKTHAEDIAELKLKLKKREAEIDRLYDELDQQIEGDSDEDADGTSFVLMGADGEDGSVAGLSGRDDSDTITID